MRLLMDQDAEAVLVFFEIGASCARNIVTGFTGLDGKLVDVLSSDCTCSGAAIDAFARQRTARFVNMCDHLVYPARQILLGHH